MSWNRFKGWFDGHDPKANQVIALLSVCVALLGCVLAMTGNPLSFFSRENLAALDWQRFSPLLVMVVVAVPVVFLAVRHQGRTRINPEEKKNPPRD